MNEKRGKLLIRDQSFPDKDGKHSWTLTHDESTQTIIIQYNDQIFVRGHKEIDHLCSTATMHLHEFLRRYEQKNE